MAKHVDPKELTILQRKIFSRWVAQKVALKSRKCNDFIEDFKTGDLLIVLMEVCSEKEFPDWKKIQTGSRAKQIDAVDQALKFAISCGVEMKGCSAENIVDGTELPLLGLCWGIMLRFMKMDDDEDDAMKFEDALKMWIQNQVDAYGLKVEAFGKSFHDGKIFCALINKFRPHLLDYKQTADGTPEANLNLAFAAANRYFGLEEYLHWDDIPKLDHKAMVVFASEFYYGVSRARKIDLAGKRVRKLIDFTKENDRLKAEYTSRSLALRKRFDSVFVVLRDTTIENTMSGATRRLELFNKYRRNDKVFLMNESMDLATLEHNLGRRLQSHKRPAYVPEQRCSSKEFSESLAEVEKLEAQQNHDLHLELNRQLKLAKVFEQHTSNYDFLEKWLAQHQVYVENKQEVSSVRAAQHALNQDEAEFADFNDVVATLPEMKGWAKELIDNTFEFSETVTLNEAAVAKEVSALQGKYAKKMTLHRDDLAREIVRARVEGWNDDHEATYRKMDAFGKAAEAALATKEVVKSIKDAEHHLALSKAIHQERGDLLGNIPGFKKVGADIRAEEYKSDHSSWKFPNPQEIERREKHVEDCFEKLLSLGSEKILILQDDLDRESFKEKLRQQHANFVLQFKKLHAWYTDTRAHVDVKEVADSKDAAAEHLVVHKANLVNDIYLDALSKAGKDIVSACYETKYSKYSYPNPADISDQLDSMVAAFTKLKLDYTAKQLKLEDDAAREDFRFKVHQRVEEHRRMFKKIEIWIGQGKAYVDVREQVENLGQTLDNLAVINSYVTAQKIIIAGDVKHFLDLGQEIHSSIFETKLGRWSYEKPDEVKLRDKTVQDAVDYLLAASEKKRLQSEDDLAREELKSKVAKWEQEHARQYKFLAGWIKESTAYVDNKEPVTSVEMAQDNLIVILDYLNRQGLLYKGAVQSFLALHKDIVSTEYKTELSQWQTPNLAALSKCEAFVSDSFKHLLAASAHKHEVLLDDLGREQFKFRLCLLDAQHQDGWGKIQAWVELQTQFLETLQPCDSIRDAEKNLKNLAARVAGKEDVTKITVASFNKLGGEILSAVYTTNLSKWSWENPADVQSRLDYVKEMWTQLEDLVGEQKEKLDLDLAKEVRKEDLRIEWGKLTAEFHRLSRDACAKAPKTVFGFLLEEVEAFEAKLANVDKVWKAKAAGLKEKYTPVWAEMVELVVRTNENPYSKFTPDHMEQSQSDMATAISARRDRYLAELEKQRGDDHACREMAKASDPMVKAIQTNKQQVHEVKIDLKPLLDLIIKLAPEPTADALKSVGACQKVLDERRIVFNRHTLNNGSEAENLFQQYTSYMSKRKQMVETELEYLAMRGLTKEQFDEMKRQFVEFDKDKSGFLDSKEFRKLLYSMGEERGKADVASILTKLGNGDSKNVKIGYDGFKEFMIEQLGDTDTADDVIQGFVLMNRFEKKCQWNWMGDVLTAEYLDYIKGTHEDDYQAWTGSVFQR